MKQLNIKKGDIVLHVLSSLYYKCENKKHEIWMNENRYYIKMDINIVPESYFYKNR